MLVQAGIDFVAIGQIHSTDRGVAMNFLVQIP